MKDKEQIKHPSYGTIVLTRPVGGRRSLFGSRVQHGTTVSLSLYEADIQRDLARDWIHSGKLIAEVEMSAGQWAHLLSSFGDGGGTPVTIRYTRDGNLKKMPNPPEYTSDLTAHELDLDEQIEEARGKVKDLLAKFDAVAEKPGKRNIAAFRHDLQIRLENIFSGLPFVADSLKKKMHDVVEDAKIEVEAFTQHHVTRLGLQAVAAGKMPTLESSHDLKELGE